MKKEKDNYVGISRSALEIMCDEQKLKMQELELKLSAEEFNNSQAKKVIEGQGKRISEMAQENQNNIYEKKEMQKVMDVWVKRQIARLEAVKMLWSIMKGGNTHRQKEQFYYQSIQILNEEIKSLEDGCHINSSELPF